MAHKGDDAHLDMAPKNSGVSIADVGVSPHVEFAANDPLEPGFILNERFEIVELVQSGGMSHVYKAVDHRRDRIGAADVYVAIKVMRPDTSLSGEADHVLEREAAKARGLSHPNIVNIFDFDEHGGQFYLVMEWLDGESVKALLKSMSGEGLPPDEAWPIIEGAAAAIEHAHRHKVVHSDINPSNIFVTRNGEIRLLDFGVARYCDDSVNAADARFAWVTKTYASPEVLAGLPPVYEDDVFSLGCVAYQLLSGTHPFGGSASSVAKQLGVEINRIPDLPDSDWQILRQSLAYTREERSISVGAFIRHRTSTLRTGVHDRSYGWLRRPWALTASAVAVAVIASGWWISQRESLEDPASAVPQESTAQLPSVASGTALRQSPVDKLLLSAAQAFEEQRLVSPDDGNARGLYGQALAIDSGNPAALRGLRTISDVYVRRADDAIRAGDPMQASSALEIAAQTDPGNPAIMITKELLIAQGNRQLAAARRAAGEGDTARAHQLLSVADNYTHIGEITLNEVRLQITRDEQFLESLATADIHIAAGRLTAPMDENAQAVLTALYRQHGDDARLLASMERLGERLLTRAAFATAAGQFANAGELLDAVDALGVLAVDVTAARAALQDAIADTDRGQPAAAINDALETPITAVSGSDTAAPPTAGISHTPVAAAQEPEFGEGQAGEQPEGPSLTILEKLGIRSYVPPRYPRRASRRGISGFVEVAFEVNPDGRTGAITILNAEPSDIFDVSAEDAVRQWRFAPQDDIVKASVIVYFDAEG